MNNIIPLFWKTYEWKDIKWKSQQEGTANEILNILWGNLSEKNKKSRRKHIPKVIPAVNSFTYQTHLSFWRWLFWPFIKRLDFCNNEASRIMFKWKYYYFNNPIKSGINNERIISILRDNKHVNPDYLIGVEVDHTLVQVIISIENIDRSQSTYFYPYTKHNPEIDPQIWF